MRDIDLPSECDLQQRKELVNKILNEYPCEFQYSDRQFETKYGGKIDVNAQVKMKLDILATYLLMGTPEYTSDTMSEHKIKTRKKTELPWTYFSPENTEKLGLH